MPMDRVQIADHRGVIVMEAGQVLMANLQHYFFNPAATTVIGVL